MPYGQPGYTTYDDSGANPTASWAARLKQIQDTLKGLNMGGQAPQGTKPSTSPPTIGGDFGANSTGGMQAPPPSIAGGRTITAAANTAPLVSAIGGVAGAGHQAESGFSPTPGRFYSDIQGGQLSAFLNDPDAQRRMYAEFMGAPGPGSALENILGQTADPEALLMAMNYSEGALNDRAGEGRLSAQQALWDKLMGRGGTAGNPATPYWVDPGTLVQNILAAGSSLGTSGDPGKLTGPGSALKTALQTPDQREASERIFGMLQTALFGMLPQTTYQVYMDMLKRLKTQYQDMWLKAPADTMPNFADYIQQKLGPNLGL